MVSGFGAVILVVGVVSVVLAPSAQALGPTDTSVSSSSNPSSIGQNVTFTATVKSATVPPPEPFVTFFDGTSLLGPAVLIPVLGTICECIPNGDSTATYSISSLSQGTHNIRAVYLGDVDNGASFGGMTQVVNAITTVTTVSTAPNPSVYGQGVTLSAHVATSPANLRAISGTVQFKLDGTNVDTALTVDGSGNASTSVSNLNVGGHTITADFVSSDGALLNSSGTAPTQQVNKADTATTVSGDPNPSVYGQSVTLTAEITTLAPGGGSPTGTVTFSEGATQLATAPVSSGGASASMSNLSVGSHPITATYSGDGNLNGSFGTTSQVVNQAASQSSVTSSINPSAFGQPVSFTVTVCAAPPSTAPPSNPSGPVTFTIDGSGTYDTETLGASPLAGCSQATSISKTALSVATHPVTTSYGGDGNFVGSAGELVGGQVVTKAPTTTTVTFVPAVPHVSQAVTFTAVVHQVYPNPTLPTGTVSFFVDGSATASATVPLVGTSATYVTTFGGGNHTVVAVYNGDGNYFSSTSAPVMPNVPCDQVITGPHAALTFRTGTTCVLNANITGGITVLRGAVLDVENSTVSGSITGTSPLSFRICGTRMFSTAVTGATGFVLIGDPTNNCAANTVKGGIRATANTGGLVIVGNTVGGAVAAVNNRGAGPLPGESSPIVSGNHH